MRYITKSCPMAAGFALLVVLLCAPATEAEGLSVSELYMKGNAYASSGNYEKAAEVFTEVIRLRPYIAEAHYNLGLCYQRLGRYGESIEPFKQAIRLKPDITEAHFALGTSYGKLARWTEAIETLKRGLRLNPNNARAHFHLGGAYVVLENREATEEEYEILKQMDPDLASQLLDFMYWK